MKKWSALITASALVLMLLSGCTGTPPQNNQGTPSKDTPAYEFTVATNTAEDSVNHLLAAKFKELLEERSNGTIKINLYENGQLGGDREITEGVINGNIDFIIGMTGSLVDFVPEAALFDLPNAFPDIETARKVLDGPILDDLKAAYEKAGIKLFAYADSGFRIMTSNVKITGLDSFKGVKIRTMENANHISYWTKLGANPTPMDFSELYMSLKQGVLDAQENPYDLIVANKMYEPQKYVVETNHLLHTLNMIGNLSTYQALPPDIQKLVEECAVEAHQYARQMADERIESRKEVITTYGDEIIVLSDELRTEMVEAVSGVYDEIRGQVGEQLVNKLLDEVQKAQ